MSWLDTILDILQDEKDFDADKHPRDEHGRFTSGGSSFESSNYKPLSGVESVALDSDHYSKLNDHERDAVSSYSMMSYAEINSSLREHTQLNDEFSQIVKHLDEAIDKTSLPSATVVYRGMTLNDQTKQLLIPGTVFEDKGFVSTSSTIDIAKGFAGDSSPNNISAVIKIHASAGTKALATNWMSQHEENEILFPRGSRFKVEAVRIKEKRTYIDVSIVKPKRKR